MAIIDAGIETRPEAQPEARTDAIAAQAPALVTLALGVMLVFSVGFVHSSVVHNGAHDTRHANGFPCH